MRRIAGLTLIEVLIALAIVSIAMAAVIKAATQNIRGTGYLEKKTMALWVGKQVLNEARVGVLALPDQSRPLTATTTLLGREWYWQAGKETTPNPHIDKIEVKVYEQEEEDASPLITLESYVYRESAE